MATTTPVLGLQKPVVGADDDIWGNMWNGNADILDTLVRPVDLAPYLLKAGGVMTGLLTLSANAANPLHAVPYQQLNSGLATKIGDAPNDGGYYARRNLGWEPSPGSAINQDAPSDGFAYGRRNASWDKTLRLLGGTMTGDIVLKGDATAALNPVTLQQLNTKAGAYLPLTGGVVAGATTINGNVFAASGSHISSPGKVVPADAFSPLAQFQEIAIGYNNGHIAFNGYVGNSASPAWKALAAGYAANIYLAPAGNLSVTLYGTVAAAGAALTGAGSFDFLQGGNFQASGAVTATTTVTSGTHVYCGGTLLINPANSWEWYFVRDGSGNHIENHRANWWTQWATADGTWSWNSPSGGCMTLTGSGDFWVRGQVSANAVVGAWVRSTGGMQADSTLGAYGAIIGYAGRVQANSTGEPSFCMHRPGYFAAGMLVNSSNQLLLANMDGNGAWQKTLGYFDSSGNFWSAAATTATYLHSTGSADIDGRMTAHGGVMSSNGCFWVADNDAYRLERQGYNGVWVFFENGTWNFQVQPNGDTSSRATSYAQNHFAYGSLCAGNAWDFVMGPGGAGRLMQMAGGWYMEWNSSSGDFGWVGASTGLFKQRQGDWLSWNQTGPVGGIGGYQNYSDARGKQDIAHTEIGLPEVMKMKPARFTRKWKPELITGRTRPDGQPLADFIPRSEIGFIAQELQEALPEAVVEVENVTGDGEARLMMTLDPIVAALVNAVKTLNARLHHLEGRHK